MEEFPSLWTVEYQFSHPVIAINTDLEHLTFFFQLVMIH